MPSYLIRNHYRYQQVIRYDSETGELTHVDFDSLTDEERQPRPGAWVRVGEDVYGVCPSPEGPLFFRNGERFALVRGAVDTTVDDEGQRRRFVLTNAGERVIDVTFTRDPTLEYDPWEGESNEFFEWFHHLHRQPHAWDLWTAEADAPWAPAGPASDG
jgi:hypothetical protein